MGIIPDAAEAAGLDVNFASPKFMPLTCDFLVELRVCEFMT
jgi:hypothetical protein